MPEQVPLGYIWGPINAEDLAMVQGTDWVITSGMTGPGAPHGRLYAIDRRDHSCNEIFPYLVELALDEARFGGQDVLDPLAFQSHGIDTIVRPDGVVELFAVNHGGRESVEVFEVLLDGPRPRLRWIGGAQLPGTTVGNDCAPLPGGGFVVSTTGSVDGNERQNVSASAGGNTGGVLEWSPGAGWRELPGTQIFVANGVEVSADGEWVFVGGWGAKTVQKVRRGVPDPEVQVVSMPILVDNLTWTRDGFLLAAGAYDTTMEEFVTHHFSGHPRMGAPSQVIRIDPETLAWEAIVDYPPETFGAATTGLEVGDEIWVGAARDHGVARFARRKA